MDWIRKNKFFVALLSFCMSIVLIFGLNFAATAIGPNPQPAVASEQVSCTLNSNGYCTVNHALGSTPAAILVSPNSPNNSNGYLLSTVRGTITATNFKVRAMVNQSTPKTGIIYFTYVAFGPGVVIPPTTPTTPSNTVTSTPTDTPTSSPSPSTSPTTPTPPNNGVSVADKYKVWLNGPNPTGDANKFPITVWMQGAERSPTGNPPLNGITYSEIGIPQNMGTPDWPGCGWCDWRMDEAVAANQSKGWHEMPWVNASGRTLVNSNADIGKTVNGWTLGDEADQNKVNGNAADKPDNYLAAGNAARAADTTRPVYSNFGAAIANRGWNGYTPDPGSTYEKDMKKYCDSSDIVSTDIYAYTNPWLPSNQRGAYYYGQTIDNIRYYCGVDKLAYGFVEGGHPFDNGTTITANEMEAATWNLIVHGANGIVYFAHSFPGADDAMLRDPNIKARAASVNARINALAAVLNSPSLDGVSVARSNTVPVSFMYKNQGGSKYILAQTDGSATLVNSGATTATFTVPVNSGTAEVVGENRTVQIVNGKIVDNFNAYQCHVYKF